MFYMAESFNQPINHFKTDNITNLIVIFTSAKSFDQDISSRNITNV
jgi:hypothetical protein